MKSILLDFNSLAFRTLPRVYIVANTLNVGWLWFEIIIFFDGWEEFLREVVDEEAEIAHRDRREIVAKKDSQIYWLAFALALALSGLLFMIVLAVGGWI